jgi:hypothetical protein
MHIMEGIAYVCSFCTCVEGMVMPHTRHAFTEGTGAASLYIYCWLLPMHHNYQDGISNGVWVPFCYLLFILKCFRCSSSNLESGNKCLVGWPDCLCWKEARVGCWQQWVSSFVSA